MPNPNRSPRHRIESAVGRPSPGPTPRLILAPARQAWRRLGCGLLALAASLTMPVQAQDTWVGRKTIGELRREQVVDTIMAVRGAVQAKAEFTRDIAAARKAFFDSATQAADRPAVEKRFADLLKAKDYYYAQQMVTEGTSAYSQKRVAGFDAITGGAVDGGIAEPTRAAFHAWVDALRTSLGARDRKQMLVVGDAALVKKALSDNMGLYETYARQRDRHEFDVREAEAKSSTERRAAIAANRAAANNLTPESRDRLFKQGQGFFDTGVDARLVLAPRQVADALGKVMRSRQPVLRCTYGPTGTSQDGSTMAYETHTFWRDQAPAGIEQIIAADRRRALGGLGTAHAVQACPPTLTLASATLSAASASAASSNVAPAAPRSEATGAAGAGAPLRARPDPQDLRAQNRQANAQRRCQQLGEQLRKNQEEADTGPPHQARYRASRLAVSERKYAQECGG